MREWKSEWVTFQHRQACSACQEWVNERVRVWEWLLSIDMKTKLVQHVKSDWMRHWKSVKVWECESVKVREWFLSIDMKTKVVQHVESAWMRDWKSVRVREFFKFLKTFLVPSFCLTFRHFFYLITPSCEFRVHRAGSQLKMSERQTKAGNQITLSLSLTISLFLTLTLIQSLIQSLLTCWTTFVFISMLKSHPHTFSLSLSLAISLSHSFNLSFNHSRHAEQVLFSCLGSKVTVSSRNFFLTAPPSPSPVSLGVIELVPS